MLMGVCDSVWGVSGLLCCCVSALGWFTALRWCSLLRGWQFAFARDWCVGVYLQYMYGVGVLCAVGYCMDGLVRVVDEDGLWNYWLGSSLFYISNEPHSTQI